METNERLLPIPGVKDSTEAKNLQPTNQEYPSSYAPFYDEDSFDERRSIREYFNVVYKRLPYILALTILTTAIVAFYMYRQPSIYSATTEMIIEAKKPAVQTTQAVNINLGNDQTYYNTQLRLLKNPELMKDVVVRLGLHNDPNLLEGQQRGISETIQSIFTVGDKPPAENNALPVITSENDDSNRVEQSSLNPQEKLRVERYAANLVGNMEVEQTERTNLVTITVTNMKPALAAKVANTVAALFIEQDADRSTRGAEEAYKELSSSIEDLKTTIAGQEVDYISFRKDNNISVGEGAITELAAGRLGAISTQLLEATNERSRLEATYNAARRSDTPYGLSNGAGGGVASELRQRNEERVSRLNEQLRVIDKEIADLEVNKKELLVKYTDDYYKVKVITAKIDKLNEFRAKTETDTRTQNNSSKDRAEKEVQSDIVKGLEAQFQTARRREAELNAAYQNELNSANEDGIAETRLTTLKREIETNRQLLDTYIQRQKEQELTIQSSRPDNIKISSSAITPISPVGPQRNRNIIVALLVSLIGGVGLSFLLNYLDDSIKSSDDIGKSLGLPTLALIPHHSTLDKKKRNQLSVGDNGLPSTSLIALEDTRSAMAEAYRHLRTSLLFSSAGKPPATILVTSSQPSEGKTTTAINTAITLAQSGAEVVLIDCDLRRPRLHSHFNMENSHGLTNYISGERNTENLLKEFPALPNLKVITSGPIPPNPAELLSSNELKHLLQFLKGNFKHIVIDSPPAISFTDAAILATLVDGVVLVAMAGKSSIHLMRRFKQRLANMGARIYGVVLNGIKPNSVEYGYYGYGYTYSYYDTPDDDDTTPRMEDKTKIFVDDEFIDEDEFIDDIEDEKIHDTNS